MAVPDLSRLRRLLSGDARIYIKQPQDAPEGAMVKRGKRGGLYYETTPQQPTGEEEPAQERRAKPKASIFQPAPPVEQRDPGRTARHYGAVVPSKEWEAAFSRHRHAQMMGQDKLLAQRLTPEESQDQFTDLLQSFFYQDTWRPTVQHLLTTTDFHQWYKESALAPTPFDQHRARCIVLEYVEAAKAATDEVGSPPGLAGWGLRGETKDPQVFDVLSEHELDDLGTRNTTEAERAALARFKAVMAKGVPKSWTEEQKVAAWRTMALETEAKLRALGVLTNLRAWQQVGERGAMNKSTLAETSYRVMEATIPVLEHFKKMGLPLPRMVGVHDSRLNPGAVAHYEAGNRAVFIKVNQPWTQMTTNYVTASMNNSTFCAVNSFEGLMAHELGHFYHHVKNEPTYEYLGKRWEYPSEGFCKDWQDHLAERGLSDYVAAKVSVYALKHPLELVAEVHAGLAVGKKYPADVMALYKEHGGPLHRGWEHAVDPDAPTVKEFTRKRTAYAAGTATLALLDSEAQFLVAQERGDDAKAAEHQQRMAKWRDVVQGRATEFKERHGDDLGVTLVEEQHDAHLKSLVQRLVAQVQSEAEVRLGLVNLGTEEERVRYHRMFQREIEQDWAILEHHRKKYREFWGRDYAYPADDVDRNIMLLQAGIEDVDEGVRFATDPANQQDWDETDQKRADGNRAVLQAQLAFWQRLKAMGAPTGNSTPGRGYRAAPTTPLTTRPAAPGAGPDVRSAERDLDLGGFSIVIENPVGSIRSGTSKAGKVWRTEMKHAYGRLRRTVGADGEAVDVFVGPHADSGKVFIVNQVRQDSGEFDEHKVMLGFRTLEEAREAYAAHYEAGWKVGPTKEMTLAQFRTWLERGDTTIAVNRWVRYTGPLGGRGAKNLATGDVVYGSRAEEVLAAQARGEALPAEERTGPPRVANIVQPQPREEAQPDPRGPMALSSEVGTLLKSRGFQAYIVGGAVRDLLLGREPNDVDIATNALPDQVTRVFQGSGYKVIPTGIEHGTVTVLHPVEGPIEVTTYRTEGKYADGRRPESVAFVQRIEDDLSRRDFTINAMAWDPLSEELVDPYGGASDLRAKVIRAVGDAKARFTEDGLRPIRAARFAAKLGFTIEADTLAAMKDPQVRAVVERVAQERVRDETLKAMESAKPRRYVEALLETGLVDFVVPELKALKGLEQPVQWHAHDALEHSLLAMEHVPQDDPFLRLVALLHDIAKPQTFKRKSDGTPQFLGHDREGAVVIGTILSRLRFPTKDIERAQLLVENHLVTYSPSTSDAALRRLVNRVGMENLPSLVALRKADFLAHDRAHVHAQVKGLDDMVERITGLQAKGVASTPKLAVSGHDIMGLGVPEGPNVGRVLKHLADLVTEDPRLNTPETLLQRAQEFLRTGQNKRVYIRDPGEAPKGAAVKRGPRGGLFYESSPGQAAPEEDAKPREEEGDELEPMRRVAREAPDFQAFRGRVRQRHLQDLSDRDLHRLGRALPSSAEERMTDLSDVLRNKDRPGSYYTTIKYDAPEAFRALQQAAVTGRITIYRAVPEDAGDAIGVGDYVTIEPQYARLHGRAVLEGEQGVRWKLLSKEVPLEDVVWGEADFNEWAYSPRRLRDQYPSLEAFYEAHHGEPEHLFGEPKLRPLLSQGAVKLLKELNVTVNPNIKASRQAVGATDHGAAGPESRWPKGNLGVALHELGHAVMYPAIGKDGKAIPSPLNQTSEGFKGVVATARAEYQPKKSGDSPVGWYLNTEDDHEFWADLFRAYHNPAEYLQLRYGLPKTHAALEAIFGPSPAEVPVGPETQRFARFMATAGMLKYGPFKAEFGLTEAEVDRAVELLGQNEVPTLEQHRKNVQELDRLLDAAAARRGGQVGANTRVYVQSPSEAPQGAPVQRGERGGLFYEAQPAAPAPARVEDKVEPRPKLDPLDKAVTFAKMDLLEAKETGDRKAIQEAEAKLRVAEQAKREAETPPPSAREEVRGQWKWLDPKAKQVVWAQHHLKEAQATGDPEAVQKAEARLREAKMAWEALVHAPKEPPRPAGETLVRAPMPPPPSDAEVDKVLRHAHQQLQRNPDEGLKAPSARAAVHEYLSSRYGSDIAGRWLSMVHHWDMAGYQDNSTYPIWYAAREFSGRREARLPNKNFMAEMEQEGKLSAPDPLLVAALRDVMLLSREYLRRHVADKDGMVTVYRGVADSRDAFDKSNHGTVVAQAARDGRDVIITPRALESWTLDRGLAEDYAGQVKGPGFAGSIGTGVVLTRKVPLQDVYLYGPFVHKKSSFMAEVTLLGRGDYTLKPTDVHALPVLTDEQVKAWLATVPEEEHPSERGRRIEREAEEYRRLPTP